MKTLLENTRNYVLAQAMIFFQMMEKLDVNVDIAEICSEFKTIESDIFKNIQHLQKQMQRTRNALKIFKLLLIYKSSVVEAKIIWNS